MIEHNILAMIRDLELDIVGSVLSMSMVVDSLYFRVMVPCV